MLGLFFFSTLMVESQKLKLLDFFVSHIYTTRASANSENKNIGGFKKIKEMLKIEKKSDYGDCVTTARILKLGDTPYPNPQSSLRQ